MKKQQVIILTAVVVITILAASGTALAASMGGRRHSNSAIGARQHFKKPNPAIGGAVAAISGTSLSITGKDGTTYTVDASNAKIVGGFGTSTPNLTLADIKVGDKIGIIGTVSGTNITATTIIDGVSAIHQKGFFGRDKKHVVGTINNVGPYSFIMDVRNFRGWNASATTTSYSVSTNSTTTVTKDGQAASLGDLAAGQLVIVTGTVDTSAHTVLATKINITTAQANNTWPPHRFNGRR